MARKVYVGVPTKPMISALNIGETVKLNVGGVVTDFIVIHKGKPSEKYAGNSDGVWLMMKDLYIKKVFDSTDNNYANSDIHAYLNGEFFGLLDSGVQSIVNTVKIPYVNGVGATGTVSLGESGLSAKVFLLSVQEMNLSEHEYVVDDSTLLDYFTDIVPDTPSTKMIAYYNGTGTSWWTRTPSNYRDNHVWGVDGDIGRGSSNNTCTNTIGIRPTLVLPKTTEIVNGEIFVSTNESDGANTSNVARKVKQIYVGIESKARRVKKGYIGIGGVARPFFSSDPAEYYGKITALSVARMSLAGATTGNTALFAGGMTTTWNASSSSVVDAYSSTLVRTSPTALSSARAYLAGTNIGTTALFGGGTTAPSAQTSSASSSLTTVDAYNESLTRTTPTALSTARMMLSATANENYAIFAGGYTGSYSGNTKVDAYNTSLTRSTPTALSTGKGKMGSARIGGYALFAGGATTNGSGVNAKVDAYNESLTKTSPTNLSTARYELAGVNVVNYALFGGGLNNGSKNVVDAYNTSLTRSTPTTLSVAYSYVFASKVGNCAMFISCSSDGSCVVDIYDKSLTRTSGVGLSVARYNMAVSTAKDYVLCAGGVSNSDVSNIVEAYVGN